MLTNGTCMFFSSLQMDIAALQRSFKKELREVNEKYRAQSEQFEALQQSLRQYQYLTTSLDISSQKGIYTCTWTQCYACTCMFMCSKTLRKCN